jgi:chemotaxis family two-component system sensor kinase Cph1
MNTREGPFGDCKRAILQNLGEVQSNGVLVAVHLENNRIEYCSANSAEFLGVEPSDLLGRTGGEWLPENWLGLYTLASREGIPDWCDFAGIDPLVVVGHRQGAHRIFEFERAGSAPSQWWNHGARTRFITQLSAVRTIEQCHEIVVNQVFERAGYDRVVMYRFLPDWDGEVVYERCRPGVGGFLRLRFPATDIPANARQMFTLNWQRAIVDVDSETSPVLKWNQNVEPLDLTYSTLRSAHPAHIQYLKNMGVQASLTLSIVANGKLWGLIACHHLSSRTLAIEDRLTFEEMARLMSLHLANLLGLIEQQTAADMRHQLSRLQGAMSAAADQAGLALAQNLGTVRQTFGAGGAWLRFEGKDFFTGRVPDKLALAPLRDFLDRFPREQVSHYAALPQPLQSHRALAANASGVLFIPLGSADFIALVRPEVIETVSWAGKPQELEDNADFAARPLTPRNSFAVWSQRVRNHADQWTGTELEFAEKIRIDIQMFLATARLEQIALHDPLTGLANRLLFERRLQQEVRNSITRSNAFAVYMIDLDRFKQVNDTLGHGAGDQLLTGIAARLVAAVRSGDTVARLGGDEFAILQTGLDNRTGATSLAEKIVELASRPYTILGHVVEIGVSVGISIYPSDTVEESELLEYADLALYKVKRSGRNAYSMYAPDMRAAEPRGVYGELLARALRDDEFRLHYQPIVDARSGELRGLEAFLRWDRPGLAELAAGEFIEQVEQKRLGPAVGEWVMDAVFRQYRQWLREGLAMVPVTINIGTAEFMAQDLLGQIEKLGARYETGWQWLRLDIKEQAVLADIRHAVRKLESLRDAGVGANLDNFGRGLVPLGYLTELPFLGIKLDAVLFEDGSYRHHFNALFNVVRSIAQVFGAQLAVTRIDSFETLETLKNQRIDLVQGYAIARPAEAARAAEWLLKPERIVDVPNRFA